MSRAKKPKKVGRDAGSGPDRPGADDPGAGRRLGVDVGSVRVGVSISDPAAILATPLGTLSRDERDDRDLDELQRLVAEHEVVEVVVGLPRTLAARHGVAAQTAEAYAAVLSARVAPVPVRLSDERLTTVTATRVLAERGVRGKRQRAVVDQAAAVEILQTWLDVRSAARTVQQRRTQEEPRE
ncbi:Holliday junction resolvase RuvX [Actinoalloteichus hymeniacidonis]|uniref:Putative pre-16S rRNA nuclease n=1 Tax=Actinoalloteichus hymeniacidonis TaxID=340345 RepID=A0AAC9HPB2_9PSEU|nr:Holliday junction resolvase RuvX [Actinoalloteichus hymeniacidonis]AOS63087.1 RNAse H-fold protein [Actinoalloteichus hymeniacidonis]MBB5908877.1 putative Holliday junction resolvase [Actinoalloteichus hymeniacidonis]